MCCFSYDSGTTIRVWDGQQIAADVSDTGVTRYVRGVNLLKADDGNTEHFYLYNAHGDVVQLTDGSGTVTKDYDYDAFGVERNRDANDSNPFRYCAEYFDNETGTIYLRARYYNPRIGRFLAEDPIRDGFNWYAYCGGNPIIYIDPTGMINYRTQSLMLYGGYMEKGVDIGRRYMYGYSPSLAERISAVSSIYEIGRGIANGEITLSGFVAMLGNGVKNATVGNILYLIDNYKYFSPDYILMDEEVWALGGRVAGAVDEAFRIGLTLQSISKALKGLGLTSKKSGITIAGKGSTGRVEAKNLNEQLAMKQVMSDPLNGATNLSKLAKILLL